MDEWLLDPRFAEGEDHDEEQEMHQTYDEEGQGCACEVCQPVSEGKGEEHQDGDEDEEEEDGQGSRRQQAYHLVHHVELHIFRLKPEVMFQHLNQLGKRLNVLVAGKHPQ